MPPTSYSTPDSAEQSSLDRLYPFVQKIALSRFFLVSLIIHLIVVLLLGSIVLLRVTNEVPDFTAGDDTGFVGPTGANEAPDTNSSLQQMQNEFTVTAPTIAPPTFQTITTIAPASFSVPTAMNLPSLSKGIEQSAPSAKSGVGGGNIGDGRIGGGEGGSSSFFGLKSNGERVVFVVDFSNSMKGAREDLMRKELTDSVRNLEPQTKYALIFFAGPAWVAGGDPNSIQTHWKHDKKGWAVKQGQQKFAPAPVWIDANEVNKTKSIGQIKGTNLINGTDWLPPLRTALQMVPPPNVVYFMTDGSPQAKNEDVVLKTVTSLCKKMKAPPTITTIALGEPKAEESLKALANIGKGQFRLMKIEGGE